MEPGEYLTNVLSSNEFASIKYEYFELHNLSTWSARRSLQRVEAVWRQEGKLAYCDPYRDGLWVFERSSNPASDYQVKEGELLSPGVVEVQGIALVQRDRGIYEPASLARSKSAIPNAVNTPTSSASPSSSQDNALRNTQALNARSTQTNALLNVNQEPPTPSPGIKSERTPSQKDVHEYFVSAVLGSVAYLLVRESGLVPLNSRTLILNASKSLRPSLLKSGNTSCNTIELATLDVSLTSLGSLVVKAITDPAPGLQALVSRSSLLDWAEQVTSGTALWLAPSGIAARFHSLPDEDRHPSTSSIARLQDSPGTQRNSGFNSLSVKSWQSKCLEWLSVKGLDPILLEAGGWVFVQVHGGQSPYSTSDYESNPMLEDLTVVPWPALLCFQPSNSRNLDHESRKGTDSASRDPISFSEEWFKGRDERASVSNKRLKERQIAEAQSSEQAAVDARAMQSHLYSPVALRRGSNAGAMYPTPPDAPHQIVGATPTFDGTVSTPGNQHPNAQVDTGQPPQTSNDVDTEMWSSGKKEQAPATTHYHEHEADNDNLFGDLGGDLLFGNDITDADFSFFDQPDEVGFDQKQASPTPVGPPVSKENIPSDTGLVGDNSHAELSPKPDLSEPEPSPAAVESNQIDSIMENADGAFIPDTPKDARIDTSTKLPSSTANAPFDKEAVFKLLVKAHSDDQAHGQPRRTSQFNKIDFETSLQAVNEKYDSNGLFSFKLPKSRPHEDFSQLPQTKYLNGRRKTQDRTSEMGHIARILMERSSLNQPATDEPMDYLVDTNFASPISEQDDSSHTTDNPTLPQRVGMKRKWEESNGDEITSSFDALAMDLERSVSTPQSATGSQLPLLDADPADWSLTTYFTSVEPDVQSTILSDHERIATAQILADQAVSATLKFPGVPGSELVQHKASSTRKLIQKLVKTTKCCLKEINPCTMRALIDIQGIPVLSQGLRLAQRPMPNPRGPNNVDGTRSNNPFAIPPPQLEIRRSDSKLSILPAAISFWENLGLGPAKGAKDVSAVCIWPSFSGVQANANTFLDQMRSIYESSRLGNHDRLVTKDLHNGLLPFAVDLQQQNRVQQMASLRDMTGKLSKVLSALAVEEKNLVVYFVYPPDNNALLVQICSAFQHLFNLYRKSLSEKKINVSNELVLQLIPLDFISSSTSIAVPLPSQYFRLALEVYDRCVDFASSSSSPAIMLEQPLPRNIDFKLNANPSASLLQENTCLHVAYAQSIDDRWITAAWTDNRGTQQMTASYCLGRKNEPISTAFSVIAHEIWETTLDFISSKKIHWRIMIARVGVMDPSEIDFWTGLAATESDAQISITLITVQTDPSLRLLPAPVTIGPNGNSTNSNVTPVSTPQAFQPSVVSPDNAPTPVRENTYSAAAVEGQPEPDSDARLIDYTDQNWGIVLSHRLNNSNSLMELNLALISGYLVKRGGTNSDDPPIVMEVNVVHSEVLGNPRTFHESLLREILGYYRGLGTLARVRGMVDAVRDVRPWHIAAAEKAVKALYMLM
ncbi:uncharacterized protein LY89DRAFT_635345 [Mollisia scopiformis]|uniref:Mediator of RNA polymerase II transcription subunit 13 n=1 Tax=Mollisia scopiformis TaxID=149040 RepID=A0A194XTW3_MOLSC|nr:uncharacterized protein LY89DRAFT_635345 [Mollisia scopiformis]KUJ23142.1 hypothetical protein LY89DRAFT_635345 [Mollisia scopiformis]